MESLSAVEKTIPQEIHIEIPEGGIAIISDLHLIRLVFNIGRYEKVWNNVSLRTINGLRRLGSAEILVINGDLVDYFIQQDRDLCIEIGRYFLDFLSERINDNEDPLSKVIIIPGNHDGIEVLCRLEEEYEFVSVSNSVIVERTLARIEHGDRLAPAPLVDLLVGEQDLSNRKIFKRTLQIILGRVLKLYSGWTGLIATFYIGMILNRSRFPFGLKKRLITVNSRLINGVSNEYQWYIFGHTHMAEIRKDVLEGVSFANTGFWGALGKVEDFTAVIIHNDRTIELCSYNDLKSSEVSKDI